MSLPSGRRRTGGGRYVLIALVSSLAVFSLLAIVITRSPSWPLVQQDFFDPETFWAFLPVILQAFVLNVQLFLIAEALVLVLGLVVAILRSLSSPVFYPIRLMAVIYADVFRALPSILIIFVLGFGVPGLGLPGVPTDPFFWACVALTLVYTAYVSEVYRAGIDSVHPSQTAAARSLGLSEVQALRFVVIPQAIRRVIPPLLNDFIGLQKDTVLVSYIGVVEAFRTAQIEQQAQFNYTPYLALSVIFLAITLPLIRLTDYLIRRDRRRYLAGAR